MIAPLTFAELDGLIAGACGCGLDHAEDGTGECDVPRLVDEIRRLHAEADAERKSQAALTEEMFKDLWTAMGHPDCGIRKWRGVLDALEGIRLDAVEGIRSERQRCAKIARSWRRLDPMHPVGSNDHAVRGEDTAATAIEQAILDDRGVQ